MYIASILKVTNRTCVLQNCTRVNMPFFLALCNWLKWKTMSWNVAGACASMKWTLLMGLQYSAMGLCWSCQSDLVTKTDDIRTLTGTNHSYSLLCTGSSYQCTMSSILSMHSAHCNKLYADSKLLAYATKGTWGLIQPPHVYTLMKMHVIMKGPLYTFIELKTYTVKIILSYQIDLTM